MVRWFGDRNGYRVVVWVAAACAAAAETARFDGERGSSSPGHARKNVALVVPSMAAMNRANKTKPSRRIDASSRPIIVFRAAGPV